MRCIRLLDVLRRAGGPVKPGALQQGANLTRGKLEKALKFLLLESPSPIEKRSDGYVSLPIPWRMPLERIQHITGLRRREQQRMHEYARSTGCLMRFLGEELSDPAARPCGNCANCRGPRLKAAFPPELALAATNFLNRLDLVIAPRKQWPVGLNVDGMHGRIPAERQARPGRVLCRWGDAGFGDWVRQDKQQTHHFRDELVEAAAALVRDRWAPDPFPAWVTCVPSWRQSRAGLRVRPSPCRQTRSAAGPLHLEDA